VLRSTYRSIGSCYNLDSGVVLLFHGLQFIDLFVVFCSLEVALLLGRCLIIVLFPELFFVIDTLIEGMLLRLGCRSIAE